MKKIFLTILSLSIILSLFASVSGADCSLFNFDSETCGAYESCSYQQANCSVFAYNEAECLSNSCTYGENYSCSEFDNQGGMCQVQNGCTWHGDAPIPQYCEGDFPCADYGTQEDCEANLCTWHPEEPVPTGWCEGSYIAGDSCNGLYFNGTCAGTFFAGIFASIDYPLNQTYSSNVTTLNYTITNATSCFYSFNETNYSLVCNETSILLDAFYESNTWTIYADNISDSVTFFVNVPQEETIEDNGLYNLMNSSGAGLGIFIQILAIALPVLLIGIASFLIVFRVSKGLKGLFEVFSRKPLGE